MTALATLDDLAALIGPVGSDDTDRAIALLHHASTLVRAETGDEFTDAVPDIVVTIVAKAAARAWNTDEGVNMQMAGPFQVQYTPGLYLTKDEKRLLGRFGTDGQTGLVSVRTRITPEILEELDDDWAADRESDWV